MELEKEGGGMGKEQGLIDGVNAEAGDMASLETPVQDGEVVDVAAQNTIENGVSEADIKKLRAIGTEMARLSISGEVSTLNIARENLAE